MPHYRGPTLDGPRVVTNKNIGRDFLKPGRNNKYRPHAGAREIERARRRREKLEAKKAGETT